MGSVVSMVLGWKGEKIVDKANQIGIQFDRKNPNSFYEFKAEDINKKLIEIHRDILVNDLKFVVLGEETKSYGHYFTVETPIGTRKLRSMTITTQGDVYDDLSDVLFGVSLNGTFSSVLMDWEVSFGEGNFSFSVTEEKFKLFQITKEKVSKEFSVFSDAEWIFQLDWM